MHLGGEQGVQPPTKNGAAAALRFFFTTTCSRPEMTRDPYAGAPAAEAAVGSDAGGGRAADRGRAAPSTRPRSRSLTALDCALSEVANLLCRTSTPSVIRVWEDPQIESAIKVKVNDLALPSNCAKLTMSMG